MNYQETVNYLFHATPVFEKVGASAYKEGLSNTLALDEHFGHPHRRYRTIHVAGTNGKGSCSHSLAAILQEAGYRVGLYTSPHLVDFRERIRVDGQCVSEEYVVDFVREERAFFEPLHPSFFELTTALAFKYFADRHVDVAVIEVGLGGRLDCTNIIRPVLSVITNISFDHTQFLGNTLALIAAEKAGIIKDGVPVVIGESCDETRPVFEQKARACHAPVFFAEDDGEIVSHAFSERGIVYETRSFGRIAGELGGGYQLKNMNTILHAVSVLRREGVLCEDGAVRRGLERVCELTGLEGRWQCLHRSPLVICDTGHNVGGWEYLSRQIAMQRCRCLRIVFGMVDDKDIDHVMDLLPRGAVYYFTQASTKRAIPAGIVAGKAQTHALRGAAYGSVEEAYARAMEEAAPDDFVFVGGSSYVVADLLTSLRRMADR